MSANAENLEFIDLEVQTGDKAASCKETDDELKEPDLDEFVEYSSDEDEYGSEMESTSMPEAVGLRADRCYDIDYFYIEVLYILWLIIILIAFMVGIVVLP